LVLVEKIYSVTFGFGVDLGFIVTVFIIAVELPSDIPAHTTHFR